MITPYETYNNQIGVRLSFVVADEGIRRDESLRLMSYSAYEKKVQRNRDLKLRAGLGMGNEVLLNWRFLPDGWKELFTTTFGDPRVEHNPLEEHFVLDAKASVFYETYELKDGTRLKPEERAQFTVNASVLQAFISLKKKREMMRKRMGQTSRGVWTGLMNDLNSFNAVLKAKHDGIQHTLPTSDRRIREDIKGFNSELGYEYYIDGRLRNTAAKKVATDEHLSMLEALLRKHNNFDNEQIALFYNVAAEQLNWKAIDAKTVANYRKKLDLYISSGNSGETNFRNTRSMQVKRTAPVYSMTY